MWAGGVREVVLLMENSCRASFQNKKDLNEQRFTGFSFPDLVMLQSMERKRAAGFCLVDINCICPKKEARSKKPSDAAGPGPGAQHKTGAGLMGPSCLAAGSPKVPISSIPIMPLKGVEANVHLSLHLMMLLTFSGLSAWARLPLLSCPSLLG